MKDLGNLMKQAQVMQQKLQDAQARLAQTLIEGSAGGGLVKVTLSGGNDLKAVTIDESLMQPGDAEMLADLIVAAHADAKTKLDEQSAALMKDVAGPLAGMGGGFPGLKF
jgi:DNA-binding YbaB/EbfC family protein